MAETAVGLFIDKLIPLLTEEANLLRGIHKEVNGINSELLSIQSFLKDSDTRAEAGGDNNEVKLWVQKLREVALKIENVIDEYIYDIAQRRDLQEEQPSRRSRFTAFLQKISCLICELKPRHNIALKIQELKQEVQDINQRGTTYRFDSSQQGSSRGVPPKQTWSDPRDGSRFLGETEVVGIQTERKELVVRLEAADPQQEVLAVVGMAGIGKTTLANQVFDEVKGKFGCHAWIDVSQTYNKLEVLRSLIRRFYQSRKESVPEGIDQETDLYMLTKSLRDYLHGKSYFVAFDDVWDTIFWADIKNALPSENGNRGRIVITTRKVEVADSCKTSSFVHIHQMKLLNCVNSLELFRKKAFHSELGNCPAELEGLSSQVVQRCGGLPLAIAVVGGLLVTKNKSAEEWTKLPRNLSSEFESNQHLVSISRILSLSYNDLPYYLKPCFLYFGIFPEDYSIRNRRLVRQWIAEGFVRPQKDKRSEAVAEEYLIELMNRSMVQVSKVHFGGKARSCRVHDLLRDFILTKIDDLHFCRALPKDDNSDLKRWTTRRVSVFHDSKEVIGSSSRTIDFSNVRSVFFFGKGSETAEDPLVTKIATSFKLLKVLDFEDASISRLPDDIGNMFHLRYLSVRGSKVKSLPKSIRKLKNLETLDPCKNCIRLTLMSRVLMCLKSSEN